MKLNSQIISYALISLFLVFVVGKVLGVLLKGLSDNFFSFSKKKSDHDFDQMIERKKALLRSTYGETSGSQKTSTKTDSNSGKKALEQYIKLNDKRPSGEMEEVINFFNSLQWGESTELSEIAKDIFNWSNTEIASTELIKYIRQLDASGVICSLHRNDLPNFKELKGLIILYTGMKQFELQCHHRAGPFLELLARRWKSTPEKVALAFEAFLHARTGMPERDLYMRILGPSAEHSSTLPRLGEHKVQAATSSLLYKADKKEFSNRESLLHNIKRYLENIEMLTPLPTLSKGNEEETALRIFGLKRPYTQEDVRSQYKKLALQKHPDKVTGKKLPDFLLKTANENFSKIQQAYEVLKKKKVS